MKFFSQQADREECNSYSHKAFRDCDFYFFWGSFGWVQSLSRHSARLFLQSSELGPPSPHPQAIVSPFLAPGGIHVLAREGEAGPGGGGGPNSIRGDSHWYSRYICTLFVQ